jgi:hypothetical protein
MAVQDRSRPIGPGQGIRFSRNRNRPDSLAAFPGRRDRAERSFHAWPAIPVGGPERLLGESGQAPARGHRARSPRGAVMRRAVLGQIPYGREKFPRFLFRRPETPVHHPEISRQIKGLQAISDGA